MRRFEPLVQRVVWKLDCRRAASARTSRRRPGSGCWRRSARGDPSADRSPRSRIAASSNQALLALQAACRAQAPGPQPRRLARRAAGPAFAKLDPTTATRPALLDTLAARRDARTDPEAAAARARTADQRRCAPSPRSPTASAPGSRWRSTGRATSGSRPRSPARRTRHRRRPTAHAASSRPPSPGRLTEPGRR